MRTRGGFIEHVSFGGRSQDIGNTRGLRTWLTHFEFGVTLLARFENDLKAAEIDSEA
jgi:hypothetical protein